MKIVLTTDLDCSHRFETEAGLPFALPGQDFKPVGGPTQDELCRGLYVGPSIVDKLDCEPEPTPEDEEIDTPGGRDPMDPPTDPGEIVIPPEPTGCPDCDVKASFKSLSSDGLTIEVINFSSCDLKFDAVAKNTTVVITPSAGVDLPAGARVPLLIVTTDDEYQSSEIVIKTDKCGDYTLMVTTIPPID